MKEIELKYGCNPNQKPAKHLHVRRRRPARRGAERPPGLHQLHGRAQLLAAGPRPAPRHRKARRGELQARLSRGRGPRLPAHRRGPARLLRRGRPLAHSHRLRPRPRSGPPLLLRRLGGALRRLRRDGGPPAPARGLRRHHRPRLHARGAGGPPPEAQGRLQRREDRPRLRAQAHRAARHLRHPF